MFQQARNRDEHQQKQKTVSPVGKAPEFRIGHNQQDHEKKEKTAYHKQADIGTVDEKILVPARKILRTPAEHVLFDL